MAQDRGSVWIECSHHPAVTYVFAGSAVAMLASGIGTSDEGHGYETQELLGTVTKATPGLSSRACPQHRLVACFPGSLCQCS